MDTKYSDYEKNSKASSENTTNICRCCLTTEKPMKDISTYQLLILYIMGREISQSDGLPPWICVECLYLLEKSVKFKYKILKAHSVLYEYVSRCAPFPIDAQDQELSKYATPYLTSTEVLICDNSGRGKQGLHTIMEHVKYVKKTELNVELPITSMVKDEENCNVKEEDCASDYDDDIPLQEFRTQPDKDDITEAELQVLLDRSEGLELQEVEEKKKKKIRKGERVKKKRKVESADEDDDEKAYVRKPIDIDPTKIALIKLNYDEQIKLRCDMSKDDKYLRCPFKCELCYKGFNHGHKLDNHMQKHSPSRGKFECKLCNMYLPTIYSYNVHELIHTTRYECLKCGRRMIDRASIVEHYSSAHEGLVKQYTCQLCGKVSHNNKTHYGHMRNHHKGVRPKCDQCGKTFVNQDSLNDHMLIHQGIKDHVCDVCGKKFRTKTQVRYHQLKHSDNKNYYCVECDVRFKSEHNLRQHLHKSLKHRDKSSLRFPCPRCDARLDSPKALHHHLAFQHDGLRLYPCPQCGAALATKNSLSKHIKSTHQGYKAPLKHVCDTCGKPFRTKNVLINHVRTHTGEKPFACDQCGSKFSQRTAMKTHIKVVHLKMKRNAKVKLDQEMDAQPIITKEEVPLVFETWNRGVHHPDIYFAVTTAP